MRILKAEKPHYALLLDDSEDAPVVDCGDGNASIQLGNVVLWFDTIADRETDERVQAWRLSIVDKRITDEVAREKSDDAYQEKAIQAQAILDGETYDPAIHDFIEIEVQYAGKDPVEAAESIINASAADRLAARQKVLSRERERVKKREKQKEWKKPKDPKDPKDKN